MMTRISVAIVAVTLVLYIFFVGERTIALFSSGEPIGIAMGAALVLLPLVAIWALWRELAFGSAATRLGNQLDDEGALPHEEVALHPSGRPVREDADALFPKYREAVEEHPESWRDWYRLGLVYDAAGDRRRARAAIRQAITLAKTAKA